MNVSGGQVKGILPEYRIPGGPTCVWEKGEGKRRDHTGSESKDDRLTLAMWHGESK